MFGLYCYMRVELKSPSHKVADDESQLPERSLVQNALVAVVATVNNMTTEYGGPLMLKSHTIKCCQTLACINIIGSHCRL